MADQLASLFWEHAASRLEEMTDRQEALMVAETMAAGFLAQNPELCRGHEWDFDWLAQAIAERMP